jgi:hypothetical protein
VYYWQPTKLLSMVDKKKKKKKLGKGFFMSWLEPKLDLDQNKRQLQYWTEKVSSPPYSSGDACKEGG